MDDFWPLGISSHGKEEILFLKVSANGHSILKQLDHKPGTPHMRRGKNEFASQRPNIFSIMPIMHSSILESLVVKDVRSGSGVTQDRAELLWSGRD